MMYVAIIKMHKCTHNNMCVFLSDLPYTTAYNVTISSSLTPADLSGFDIMISWTVSDDSICGGLLHILLKLFSVCDNSLSSSYVATYIDIV